MISSGYFKVTRETLTKLSKAGAKKFIKEMFDCGGRIGFDEYKLWSQRIEEGLHNYNN